MPFSLTFRIRRAEVRGSQAETASAVAATTAPVADNSADPLAPDDKVPVGGKPLSLLQGKTLPADPVRLARVLYDVVDDHMQYRKDKPGWGTGDALWACDSGFGNCTDFHSLFISLARAEKLPARFEIGFLLPDKPGPVAGYHCWAWFKPGEKPWMPVDISEANQHPQLRDYYFGNLTPNRVCFTTGRDLILSPPQKGPPLNFFIYPYAEVDGKPVPAAQIKRAFSYEEVPATATTQSAG